MSTSISRRLLVVVPAGETVSKFIPAFSVFDDALSLTVVSPSSFQGGSAPLFELGRDVDKDGGPTEFVDYLDSDGVQIPLPPTDAARTYFNVASTQGFRIAMTGTISANVIFEVYVSIVVQGGGMG